MDVARLLDFSSGSFEKINGRILGGSREIETRVHRNGSVGRRGISRGSGHTIGPVCPRPTGGPAEHQYPPQRPLPV
jgi:hypothetical protein